MTVTAIRVPESDAKPCPIWCEQPHDADDDGLHGGANVTLRTYMHAYADGAATHKTHDTEVRVGLEQDPEGRHPLVVFENGGEMGADMTAGEADNLANILKDFAADMRQACGDRAAEPGWCNQQHGPGDGHHSDVKTVYLSNYGGLHPREMLVMVAQPPHQRTFIEVCHWKGDSADRLLASEAERLGDTLALLSLAARLYEGATR